MNKFEAARMIKLADHLETIPRKNFDMSTWGREKPECGTVACAMGHACDIPAFKKLGVKGTWATMEQYVFNDATQDYDRVKIPSLKVHMRGTDPEDFDGFDTAEKIFGIDHDEAYGLFGDDNFGLTPKQVAKSLRKFVKSKGF